jgi:hypothetical protein
MKFTERLQHAWNAFRNKEPTVYEAGTTYRPDRSRFARGTERTIVAAIINRIAIDVSCITVEHVQLDQNRRYKDVLQTDLNECLTLSANLDQTGRAFWIDAVTQMLDKGDIAIVPVETDLDPNDTGSIAIKSIRVGQVVQWYPSMVTVDLYDERDGERKETPPLSKKFVALPENPLYSVMNEPNSTLQRLKRQLVLLDRISEQNGSGKFNLIIQLPYSTKNETRKVQAERRTQEIQAQLVNSQYGIAYSDVSEKIIQLNRAIENNALAQIEYLTSMLYSQLGMTQAVLDGTADEATMLNYYSRTVEPILAAIVDEMRRKFITKTARTQGKSIVYYRDPFKLVPVSQMAEIADKFTRNEILSTNEVRAAIGYKPVDDPRADELRNKNLNQAVGEDAPEPIEVDGAGSEEPS